MQLRSFFSLGAAVAAAVLLAGCAAGRQPAADQAAFAKARVQEGFIKGADLSSLKEMLDSGFIYRGFDGKAANPMELLQAQGINYIRLRLWNDPYSVDGRPYGGGTNDLETDLYLAKMAKSFGLKVLLDFHYSDFWADPGKQFKPKAWQNLSFEELNQAVYDYTREVISRFISEGAAPDMVQVGNEINSGMLWPDGKSWGGDGHEFDRLAALLKSAISGVRDGGCADAPIMLHLAEATKKDTFQWWFDEITARGVPFDIIGMSMYPWFHGTIAQMEENLKFCAERYHKDLIIVETAYAYTLENYDAVDNVFTAKEEEQCGYPATPEGQAAYLRDLMETVSSTDGGRGVFYWEAAWKTGPGISWASQAGMDYIDDHWNEGNSYENQALFDADGRLLPSVQVFND